MMNRLPIVHPRHLVFLMLCIGGVLPAAAKCTLTMSNAVIEFPKQIAQSLPFAAVAPGFRKVGERTVQVTGNCTEPRSTIELAIRGQEAGVDGAFRWGKNGVLVLTASAFNVNGIPVRLRLSDAAADAWTDSVRMRPQRTVIADLSRTTVNDRKSFSLTVRVEARIPAGYTATAADRLSDNVQIDLLGE